eukprot:155611-Pyramimonas_sp.AAC.1
MLPHEEFARLYEKDPAQYDVSKANPDDLPSTYRSHVVTQAHGLLSCPLALYSDGVPYSKND